MSKPTPITPINNMVDIDLSVTSKRAIRFNQDDKRVVEINIADMNFVRRMSESYPKLKELSESASKLTDGLSEGEDTESVFDDLAIIGDRLAKVDSEMRELIDYMFNAPVSQAAAPDGSMYDIFNGQFRYDIIISALMAQYDDNMNREFNKMQSRFSSHTEKYTKGKR